MRKTISIILLSVYLLSTTEMHQLLKLPVVFAHFEEHRQEDKNVTFFQFVKIHYLDEPVKDKDYQRDQQLPFKSTGDCFFSIVPAAIPATQYITGIFPFVTISSTSFFITDQVLYSSYLANIWQPPKQIC